VQSPLIPLERKTDYLASATSPVQLGFTEAAALFPGFPVDIMVSLGAGLQPIPTSKDSTKEFPDLMPVWERLELDFIKKCLAAADQTEIWLAANEDKQQLCHRFNPPVANADVVAKTPADLQYLVDAAADFISDAKVAARLRSTVETLVAKSFFAQVDPRVARLQQGLSPATASPASTPIRILVRNRQACFAFAQPRPMSSEPTITSDADYKLPVFISRETVGGGFVVVVTPSKAGTLRVNVMHKGQHVSCSPLVLYVKVRLIPCLAV
jgi:hypothetical protein